MLVCSNRVLLPNFRSSDPDGHTWCCPEEKVEPAKSRAIINLSLWNWIYQFFEFSVMLNAHLSFDASNDLSVQTYNRGSSSSVPDNSLK